MRLDNDTLARMESKTAHGLDLTGENGEYHTMVVGGPMYKIRLKFQNVNALELVNQRGQKDGERWWVMQETTELVSIVDDTEKL